MKPAALHAPKPMHPASKPLRENRIGPHPQAYEHVFHFNRRRNRHVGFATLLGLGARHESITYNMLIAGAASGSNA
jgi:hypothetical protein